MAKTKKKSSKKSSKESSSSGLSKADQRRLDRAEKKRLKKQRRREANDQYKNTWNQFVEQLSPLGLVLRDTNPDGNCLFRSIADQVVGDQNRHMEFREKAVAFMRANQDDFAPFLEEDFDEYCEDMEERGTWGGNMELVAISRVLGMHVVIHQLNAPRLEISIQENPKASSLHVAYHDQQHYSSIRKQEDAHSYDAAEIGDLKIASSGTALKKRSGASGDPFANLTHEEHVVVEQTGCRNLDLVRKTLAEMWNDPDSAVEYLFSIKMADDEEFFIVTGEEGGDEKTATDGVDEEKQPSSSFKSNSRCPCGSKKKYRKCCGRKKVELPNDDDEKDKKKKKSSSRKDKKNLQAMERREEKQRKKAAKAAAKEDDDGVVVDMGSLAI